MTLYRTLPAVLGSAGIVVMVAAAPRPAAPVDPVPAPPRGAHVWADPPGLFQTSDRCMACHKGVSTSAGEDVSIGYDWRASMMANSARDPYWQASVRREILDHPSAAAEIEDECSKCHMPMARATARARGEPGSVFANLPTGRAEGPDAALAADGVSCALCHQIMPDRLGDSASFTGRFELDPDTPSEGRAMFGPFDTDDGRIALMHSATTFRPTLGTHVQESELCGTCHTLFTSALGTEGQKVGELPEQMPYLEWRASAFAGEGRSCQSCHMPEVEEAVPVTGVLGARRDAVSRHVFRGGNFFMLAILNRYRDELGVSALSQELELAIDRTLEHLRTSTATLSIERTELGEGRLLAEVAVVNRAGHKFPTAYPSRRVWINLAVRDALGRVVFESGAPVPDGSVRGNDNDMDSSRYEPHHTRIESQDDVQIYEAILMDPAGRVTTGLLTASGFAKDNRLLPRGFDAAAAGAEVAVHGDAASDADFAAPGDRVLYVVDLERATGPYTVEARLWYQPISYRWARNLAGYDSFETRRFVGYYEAMSHSSAVVVAEATAIIR